MTAAIQTHSRTHYDDDGEYVGDPACARCREAQSNLELDLIDETSPALDHVVVAEWTRGDGAA